MSVIKIDENFSIEIDSNNFTLKKEVKTGKFNDKGNEIISSDQWYCSNITRALKRYVHESMRELEELTDVKGVLSKIDELETKINNLKFQQ